MTHYDEENKSQQMQQLRELVLGKDNSQVYDTFRQHAREVVGDVLSEALHDRQKKDGSVNQVIVPIVEKSVEKSVSHHSEQFVGYLYPLVGRLVRKSVSAFLAEFLEKTNELIENSLTIKGLKWRFKAWQAGVSFSQYVASQTFVYRVEQVFLIHRETGILLNSVSLNQHDSADADMVSGMLTAINDFVSDSFTNKGGNNEQQLDVIKTDDFSLYINPGPNAILVAAVTGNIPHNISTQWQYTLEYIHKLFGKELIDFEGDTVPFENADQQLRECLVAELRPEIAEKTKRPWFAWIFLAIVLSLILYAVVAWWKQNQLISAVSALENEPGVSIKQLQTEGWRQVKVDIFRDPDAISVEEWLKSAKIDEENLIINEQAFLSLEPELIKKRLELLLNFYPEVILGWEENVPRLSGQLTNARRLALAESLQAIDGLVYSADMLENVEIKELDTRQDDNPIVLKALLDLNIAKIESVQIDFDKGQSTLNAQAEAQLEILATNFLSVIQLAKRLERNVGLIVMGASDSVGNRQANQRLSQRRAQEAQRRLIELGVDPGYLNAIGLGEVEIKATGSGARKVLFNVVHFDTE